MAGAGEAPYSRRVVIDGMMSRVCGRGNAGARLLALTILLALISRGCPYFGAREPVTVKQASPAGERCFCELRGNVDDCSCKIETIDNFNARFIQPKISSLLRYSYFRYFKVNMHKACPFWADDSRCALRDCAVEECAENDVPVGLKGRISTEAKYSRGKNEVESQIEAKSDADSATSGNIPFGPVPGPPPNGAGPVPDSMSCGEERNLSAVDSSLTAENKQAFKEWKRHDDKKEYFCELDDEDSGLQYVDLLKNPERFTGYAGPSAHRIWRSIYQENCFKEDVSSGYQDLLTQGGVHDSCLEKRVFYRVISGLHTSINVHLSAEYLLKGSPFDRSSSVWGPNAAEFQRRFDPASTGGRGPQWLRNLYLLYLLELRALAKVSPYLLNEKYFTGNKTEDDLVRREMKSLLRTVQEFDDGQFDEASMFANKMEGISLKEEFKQKFRNISRIMDCVGCDKCKLWGKIQITGLGTALRILFPSEDSELFASSASSSSPLPSDSSFSLQRSEIVALLNAFGRVSSSIEYVHMFRDLLYT